MKNLLLISLLASVFTTFSFGDCGALISKYNAPDPASKTMKQIERWVKRKVTDATDAPKLQECLIAGAADNPNKVKVAGK